MATRMALQMELSMALHLVDLSAFSMALQLAEMKMVGMMALMKMAAMMMALMKMAAM